jgi:hypothetical protein
VERRDQREGKGESEGGVILWVGLWGWDFVSTGLGFFLVCVISLGEDFIGRCLSRRAGKARAFLVKFFRIWRWDVWR